MGNVLNEDSFRQCIQNKRPYFLNREHDRKHRINQTLVLAKVCSNYFDLVCTLCQKSNIISDIMC